MPTIWDAISTTLRNSGFLVTDFAASPRPPGDAWRLVSLLARNPLMTLAFVARDRIGLSPRHDELEFVDTLGGLSLTVKCDQLWYVTDYDLPAPAQIQVTRWPTLRWVNIQGLGLALLPLVLGSHPGGDAPL